MADTQFGRDSTSHRHPQPHELDSFLEVQPATFDQLVADAAKRLSQIGVGASEWSGLLHLGDVISAADYAHQGQVAIEALRSSAELLGISNRGIVIAPGNHDIVRSGFIRDLRELSRIRGLKKSLEQIIGSIRHHAFERPLPDLGFASFRDMYSRLVSERVNPSDGGLEIVSFIAPRVTVHIPLAFRLMHRHFER